MALTLAALLSAIALLWTYSIRRTGTGPEHLGVDSDRRGITGDEVVDLELTELDPSGAGREDGVIQVSPDVEAGALIAHEPQDAGPALVRVVLEDTRWIHPSKGWGTVTWGNEELLREPFTFRAQAGFRAAIELPMIPTRVEEFQDAHAGSFSLDLVSLRRTKRGPMPEFELVTAWKGGATLVWADTVPASSRTLVSVALGGGIPPAAHTTHRTGPGGRRDRTVVCAGMTLPLTLPQRTEQESVWVGAPGYAWRAFRARPDATRIEVALAPAASIEVRHAAAKGGEQEFVFVRGEQNQSLATSAFTEAGSITFTDLPAVPHIVWTAESERYQSRRTSHLASVELVAGETAVVDLTPEHAAKHLGGFRVHLHGSAEAFELAGDRLAVELMRRTPAGSQMDWEHAGYLTRLRGNSSVSRVYEGTGLVPQEYRVIVHPLGATASYEVVVGGMQRIDVSIGDLGRIELDVPGGYGGGSALLSISTVGLGPAGRNWIRAGSIRPDHAAERTVALVPGTYFVSLIPLESEGQSKLVSGPVTVYSGTTVAVGLEVEEQIRVEVVARDLRNEELIPLEAGFWLGIGVTDTSTGEPCLHSTTRTGSLGNHTSVEWALKSPSARVSLALPENQFWSFEELLPVELKDGMTIELWARPK